MAIDFYSGRNFLAKSFQLIVENEMKNKDLLIHEFLMSNISDRIDLDDLMLKQYIEMN